jgi:hypothetical protein
VRPAVVEVDEPRLRCEMELAAEPVGERLGEALKP